MTIKNWIQTIILAAIIFSATSCRLGEFLSEVDPKTQAEIEREESIPQNENLDYHPKKPRK